MSLAPGTRLGPYEIVAPLGAGGMGEVYRAKDPRLGREVAIKVLPAELASDPERLRRFEQEAKAVSALNHPHIVTLYEVGESPSGPYLVLEKIEGQSLRELLRDGALPVKRVLTLGAQVAEGLAKAHAAGIVHRDLKPENVMVTGDGFAKILDFGLAKLVYPELETGGVANATTLADKTGTGMIVGTLGYLSPEQAVGKPADFRSDQFALGALLYELATGERPFKKETVPESLAAVIRETPEPLRARNAALPPQLGWIVDRCLEKDPNDRYASTRDLARDLADLRDHLSEVTRAQSAALVAAPLRRWRAPLAWSALGAVLSGSTVGAVWRLVNARSESSSDAARPQPTYQQLTFRRGYVGAARFAPDGGTVVFSAAWNGAPIEPFVTRLDNVEARAVGAPGAQVLAVSPAGELATALGWTQFNPHVGLGTLARLPIVGGAPRELLERVSLADWAPDGKSLAILVGRPDGRALEFPVGKPLYAPKDMVTSLRVSPRGDRVAILERAKGDHALVVFDLAGKATTLSRGWSRAQGLAWTPDGEEIWFTAARSGIGRSLHAVRLDGSERLVARVPGSLTLHDIGADGSVLLSQDNIRRETFVQAPGASAEREISWLDYSWPLDLSADGRTLLFAEGSSEEGANAEMYLRPTDGSPPIRLGQTGVHAALSPDGESILNAVADGNRIRLEILPTGAGEPKPLEIPGLELEATVFWFPNGREILFMANEPDKRVRPFARPLPAGRTVPLAAEGVYVVCVSPDGTRFLAQSENAAGIYPIAGGAPTPLPRALVDRRDFVDARFGADGLSLFTLHILGGGVGRIEHWDLASGSGRPWKELRAADPAGVLQLTPIDVTGDGKSYVYTILRVFSTLYRAEGLE